MSRLDISKTLAVEMPERDLDIALNARRIVVMAVVEAPDQTGWKRVRAVRVRDFDKATQPRIKLANPPCRAAREAFRSSGTIRAGEGGRDQR
jgi:hypothetical protein